VRGSAERGALIGVARDRTIEGVSGKLGDLLAGRVDSATLDPAMEHVLVPPIRLDRTSRNGRRTFRVIASNHVAARVIAGDDLPWAGRHILRSRSGNTSLSAPAPGCRSNRIWSACLKVADCRFVARKRGRRRTLFEMLPASRISPHILHALAACRAAGRGKRRAKIADPNAVRPGSDVVEINFAALIAARAGNVLHTIDRMRDVCEAIVAGGAMRA